MSRNHLVQLSIRARSTPRTGVWRMTVALIGWAFGAPSAGAEPRL